MTRFCRSITTAAVLAGLTLSVAGCGSDNEPNTLPTESASSSTSPPSSSPSPTSTAPAWQANYTPKEIKAYEEAFQRWESYENRSESIWAKGKVTPAAEALFKSYWINWPNQLNILRFYEKNGITTTGLPEVLSSMPTAVVVRRDGISVSIQQCIDDSRVKTKSAAGVAKPRRRGPYNRMIRLIKRGAGPYQITIAKAEKKATSCGS